MSDEIAFVSSLGREVDATVTLDLDKQQFTFSCASLAFLTSTIELAPSERAATVGAANKVQLHELLDEFIKRLKERHNGR